MLIIIIHQILIILLLVLFNNSVLIQYGKGNGNNFITLPISYKISYSACAIAYFDGSNSTQCCVWNYNVATLSKVYFETKADGNWWSWGVCWIAIGC